MTDNALRHVPVVIVGAGPTGITAATLLAQYGIESLILERWPGVYPQPRAVHLDDEIYRIIARLGIADEFAAISRPTLGLRLLDNRLQRAGRVPPRHRAQRPRLPAGQYVRPAGVGGSAAGEPQALPERALRGEAEVTDVISDGITPASPSPTGPTAGSPGRCRLPAGLRRREQRGPLPNRFHMRDLNFEQRWLVVDVATEADLGQWDGVYQVCDPVRAGTYMRIGASRYRWEFQLLAGESADDFGTLAALRPLIASWTADVADSELTLLRVTEYTFRAQIADRWRRGNIFLLGDAAHLTPPFIGQGMGAGLRDAMNLAWKIAGVRRGTLAADALDSYEQERKKHARQLIRLALNVGWSMTGGGRLGDLTRRAVLPDCGSFPGCATRWSTPRRRHCAVLPLCTDPGGHVNSPARYARIRFCPWSIGSMIYSAPALR